MSVTKLYVTNHNTKIISLLFQNESKLAMQLKVYMFKQRKAKVYPINASFCINTMDWKFSSLMSINPELESATHFQRSTFKLPAICAIIFKKVVTLIGMIREVKSNLFYKIVLQHLKIYVFIAPALYLHRRR
jgi:hypothetical protein